MGFRLRKSVRCGYVRQGYIYFVSRSYVHLDELRQNQIRTLCQQVGGPYEQALFEFVTTDHGATAVCMRHHIASRTTLDRLVRAYYEQFPTNL